MMRFKNLQYSHTDEHFEDERDVKFTADFFDTAFQQESELLTVEIWVSGESVNVVIVDTETNWTLDTTTEEELYVLKEYIRLNL